MSVFVSQKNPGLNDAITQGGNLLSNIFKSRQNQKFGQLIEQNGFNQSTLGQILGQNGGAEFLTQIAPLIKQQQSAAPASGYLANAFQQSAQERSPIEQARSLNSKIGNTGPIKVTPQEERNSAKIVDPGISGVSPNLLSPDLTNRKGPREQTVYEQGGQEGMGLNPPSETDFSQAAAIQQSPIPEEEEEAVDFNNPSTYREEHLGALEASENPAHRGIAKQERLRREKEQKKNEKLNDPFFKRINSLRNKVNDQEINLGRVKEAVKGKNLRSIVNRLGFDVLKTSDAIELGSATKALLLSDIQGVPGKGINMFLEKQIADAMPKAVYSREANEKIVKALDFKLEANKKELEITDELLDYYQSRGKAIPANFDRQVEKKYREYLVGARKELVNDISSISKEEKKQEKEFISSAPKGRIAVISPEGQSFFLDKGQEELARKKGFKIL